MLKNFLLWNVLNERYRSRERSLRVESGFTLMELLIVLALVAVISMIAVPIYRSYMQSAKITEGLTLSSGIQLDMEVYYTLNNQWPSETDAHSDLKIGAPTDYKGSSVESISVSGAVITVVYDSDEVVGANEGEDVELTLMASVAENGGVIRWTCQGNNISENDLPSGCH